MNKLLTVQEAADYLGCHKQSVYKNKELPFITIPGVGIRFKPENLDKYIEQHLNRSSSFSSQSIDNKENRLILSPDYGSIISGGNSEMPKGKNKARYNFGYGAIYQRKTSKGKIRWYLDYREASGERIQKVASNAITKEEAAIALQKEIKREFDHEYQLKRPVEKIKFFELADMYIENYAKVNKRSWKTDMGYMAGMKKQFKNLSLEEITALEIEKYKAERLKQGVKQSTVNRCLTILRRMLNLSVEWGYLPEGKVPKIKFFTEKDNLVERILKKDEEKRLLETSPEYLRLILIVALNTGMRLGEILNLKWNQVDFNSRLIKVDKTKSGRIRFIPINDLLLKELLKLKSTNSLLPNVFFNPKTRKPFITVKKAFKGACKRAEVSNLRFHDLRHTFASRLVEKGIDLITVKDLLGHSSVTITERYTHSFQDQKRKAVELLSVNAEEIPNNSEDLLHNCDMDKRTKVTKGTIPLFSIN